MNTYGIKFYIWRSVSFNGKFSHNSEIIKIVHVKRKAKEVSRYLGQVKIMDEEEKKLELEPAGSHLGCAWSEQFVYRRVWLGKATKVYSIEYQYPNGR